MINVYLSGFMLLVVSYAAQSIARSHASESSMLAYAVYLLLINWSTIAESVVFTTLHKPTRIGVNVDRQNLYSFIKDVATDRIVQLSLIFILLVYPYYRQVPIRADTWLIAMLIFVALAFFLRMVESNGKSHASRAGNHVQQQIITNVSSCFKMLVILIAIFLESELLLYVGLSVVSIVVIHQLLKFSNFSWIKNETEKPRIQETTNQRWIMYLATILGVFSYQLDKFMALKYMEKSNAAQYILSYSLVFILLQLLSPIFNRFLSESWATKTNDDLTTLRCNSFDLLVKWLAFIGSILNLAFIILIISMLGKGIRNEKEIVDLVFLSLAIYICVLNHIFYFNNIATKKYNPILYQNLFGLIAGLIVSSILILNNKTQYASVLPLSVSLGQYLYSLSSAEIHSDDLIRSVLERFRRMFFALTDRHLIGIASVGIYAFSNYIVDGPLVALPLFGLFIISGTFMLTCRRTRDDILRSIKEIIKLGNNYGN